MSKAKFKHPQLQDVAIDFKTVFEATKGLCVLFLPDTPHYTIIAASNDMCERVGIPREQFIGKSVFEAFPAGPHDPHFTGHKNLRESLDHVLLHKQTQKMRRQRYDIQVHNEGFQETYWNNYSTPVLNDQNEVVYIIHTAEDVTDMIVSRRKLQESEARLQKIISIETVGVIYFDFDGKINDCNAAFEKMCGYSREDMQAGKVRWDELTPPEFIESTMRSRDQLLTTGQNVPYEKQYIRPDGSRWWGLFAGKRLSENECVEFVLDISMMKQVEEELEKRVNARTHDLERLTQELLRSNQSLEQFAYAASHDMKEPLRKALMFSDRLKQSLREDLTEVQGNFLLRMENAILRMQTLIDDLLSYSHVTMEPRGFEDVNLNEVLANVLTDLDEQIAEKRAVVKVDQLPHIKGHHRQLQQMFLNLLINSLKYSRSGVDPQITIISEMITGNRFGVKQFYLIKITDNGIGFEQHHSNKIFEVFTRLHNRSDYKGSGIGLSIVKRVVESHNGFVEAEGKPGAGATFKLYFPVESVE